MFASGRPWPLVRLTLHSGRATLLLLLIAFACLPAIARATPPAGWAYERPITIDNTARATPLVGYQVHVVLQSPNFDFAHARSDGGDVRFANATGTPLPFWIESWDAAAGKASVWVRADNVPGSSVGTIQLAYGNPAATGISDGHSTFTFFDGFESKNAAAPLPTPTYDGTGQAMHPSVVYVPAGWNGYEYWMGMTPYSFDQDSRENPSILASHDGLTWVVPAGLTNPIAGPFSGGYNDDTELLLVNNTLVLYYLQTFTSGPTNFRRTTSTDGTHWSAPTTVLSMPNYPVSPTIVIEGGTWKMWYCNSAGGCYSSTQDLYSRTSSDGITWSAPTLNTMSGANVTPWHPEVRKDGSKYVMLVAGYDPSTTCEHCDLWYAESTDGLNWTFSPRPIVARTAGGWDNFEIYRTSFLVSGGFMRVWYSASSTAHVWGTAYVSGTLQDFLAAGGVPWDYSQGGVSSVTSPVRTGQFSLREVGGGTYPQIEKEMTGKFAVTAWYYDALDQLSEHTALLRVWDPGTAQYPVHSIGVGLNTDQSKTNYSIHTEGFVYSTTALPRTVGWHKLTLAVAPATCRLLLDDTNVGNLAVMDENRIESFSMEGDVAGTSWFDDVYARQYVEPEPLAAVGAEPNGNTPPVASIGSPANPAFFGVGDVIALSGSATDGQDPAGSLLYHWQVDLHHGASVQAGWFTADGPTASFTAAGQGDNLALWYQVKLQVTDSGGLVGSAQTNVYGESDLSPSAVATTPLSPTNADAIQYQFWIRNAGRMPAASSRWRLVLDGSTIAERDTIVGAADSVLVTANAGPGLAAGNHTLRAVVDTLGAIAETIESNNASVRTLTIGLAPNRPPVAAASGSPTSGLVGLAVAFSSAGSSDPDADPLAYAWAFGDGQSSTAANPSHTYAAAGAYSAVLTVSDGRGGSAQATVPVTVYARPAFPSAAVLDNFNRANGAIGSAWSGTTTNLAISGNVLVQTKSPSSAQWVGASFGADQEAYVTLVAITSNTQEHDLLLKMQGATTSSPYLQVRYDNSNRRVRVYTNNSGLTLRGTINSGRFSVGDRFGARAYADGRVEVYRNGNVIGTISVTAWPYYAQGGKLGMTIVTGTNSRFDDFGGGDIVFTPPAAAMIAAARPAVESAADAVVAPSRLALSSAFPNPSQGSIAFTLELPHASDVEFAVHDVLGRVIWREGAREYAPGRWTLGWPGTTLTGSRASAGLYLASVRVGGERFTRRIALVR